MAVETSQLPKKHKPRRIALKNMAVKYNVSERYPEQLVSAIKKGKKLATRKGAGGRPRRIVVGSVDEQLIRSTLEDSAWALTFEKLEEKTGIPKSTTQRFMKENKWRQVTKGTRPCLEPANITGRLKWAQDNEKNTFKNHVDLDEKWAYVFTKRVKLKLPPGMTKPKSRQKSKRYIGKVMVLTAIARPDARHGFDGKVGIWRVWKRRTHPDGSNFPAQRGDKRTGLEKGDDIWQDCNMDGKMFEHMLRTLVIPAIRRKMSWAKKVALQFDNAPGHKTKGNKAEPDSAIAIKLAGVLKAPRAGSPEIVIFVQEPNSPDTNANDLGFYNSWDSRLPEVRSFKLDEFWKQCKKCFDDYPSELLDKIFDTKMTVIKCIIGAGGDNTYKLPHKKKRD